MRRDLPTSVRFLILLLAILMAMMASCVSTDPKVVDNEGGDASAGDRGRRSPIGPADSVRPDARDGGSDIPIDAIVPPSCNGGPCTCTPETAEETCSGLPCVDGYCCAEACDGPCTSCSLPGHEGICFPYSVGNDPEDDCPTESAASCGTTGACDGAGQCAFYETHISCNDGLSCSSTDRCDGLGECRGDLPEGCELGDGNQCCIGTCLDSGSCASEAGICPDVCGETSLTIGGTCAGCGSGGAVGLCEGGGTYRCDADEHSLCQEIECDGLTYWCGNVAGEWAWQRDVVCDDDNLCTYGDRCTAGQCAGTTLDCTDTTCADRECNGSEVCTMTPKSGDCEDGDLCTYGDTCEAGECASGTSITCDDSPCISRVCAGTETCSETILDGADCEDGNACTYGETCDGEVCGSGTTVNCDGLDTTCLAYSCDGTATCAATAQNIGGECNDGDPDTDFDECQPSGVCLGTDGCPPPVESCTTGSQNRRGCGGARTIGRVSAAAGILFRDNTCGARDDFEDSSGCWDANNDHSYRLYMRQGESVSIRYETDDPCAFSESSWYGTLKIFETAGCDATGCTSKVYCDYNERDQSTTYVAVRDGWIIIVADGSSAFDDEGDYDLTVNLTCHDADCECP